MPRTTEVGDFNASRIAAASDFNTHNTLPQMSKRNEKSAFPRSSDVMTRAAEHTPGVEILTPHNFLCCQPQPVGTLRRQRSQARGPAGGAVVQDTRRLN